jgi:hypothetical protein
MRPILADVADASESLTRLHRKLSPPGRRRSGGCAGSSSRAGGRTRRRPHRGDAGAGDGPRGGRRHAAHRGPGSGVDELRRLATISLAAGGSTIVDTERTSLDAQALLSDPSQQVRIEAVRAWARNETVAVTAAAACSTCCATTERPRRA